MSRIPGRARLALGALGLVVLLAYLRPDGRAATADRTARGQGTAGAADGRALAARPDGAPGRDPAEAATGSAVADGDAARDAIYDDARRIALEQPDSPLADYLARSVYPPTSRPLRPEQLDLIEWNRRYDQPREVTADGAALSVLLTADAHFVTDRMPTLVLDVRRDGRPAPVRITAAFLSRLRGGVASDAAGDLVPIELTPAGDVHVHAVAASDLAHIAEPAIVGAFVEFELADAGPARHRASLRFHYTPPARAPARFSGQFREAIEDGSLVVYAGLDVRAPGRYIVDANLWAAGGEPVAWTRAHAALEPGEAEVRLVFFGKVLVDADAAGPYRVGDLRGLRLAEGADPDTEHIAPYAGVYETRTYASGELSAAEWDSPRRRAQLERLARAALDPGAPRVVLPR